MIFDVCVCVCSHYQIFMPWWLWPMNMMSVIQYVLKTITGYTFWGEEIFIETWIYVIITGLRILSSILDTVIDSVLQDWLPYSFKCRELTDHQEAMKRKLDSCLPGKRLKRLKKKHLKSTSGQLRCRYSSILSASHALSGVFLSNLWSMLWIMHYHTHENEERARSEGARDSENEKWKCAA